MSEASKPPSGIELRRAPRYPMPPTGGAVSVVGARLVNVSTFGVLIESPVAMGADAVLPLRLVIGGHKVDLEARVIQCRAEAAGQRRVYLMGLEFVSLPPEVRQRLAEVLRSTLLPSAGPGPAASR